MDFLYRIFYVCLSLSFLDWRLTLARGFLFLLSAEYSAVMCGAWLGTLVT